MPEYDSAALDQDEILDGITRAVRDPELAGSDPSAHVLSYYMIAEWIDGDGDRQLFLASPDDQRLSCSLGLVDYAHTALRAKVAYGMYHDEDD